VSGELGCKLSSNRRAADSCKPGRTRPLIENPDKTLQDVILAIIEYENIVSRGEYAFDQLTKMGVSPLGALTEIDNFTAQVAKDIKESIAKKVKKSH